ARHLDLSFERFERSLQAQEILARLEVGIRLRQCEELAERLAQCTFGGGAPRHIAARHAERVVARLYHRVECFSLMCGVAAQRVDQIGNEISAPLELYVYPGPTFFSQLPRAHEAVVQMNEITNRQNQNGEDDEKYFHEIYSVVLNGAVSGSSGIAFSRKDFFQPALGTSHCRAFDIHGLVRNAVLC